MLKNLRTLTFLLLVMVVGITYGFGKIEKNVSQVKSYPATVCPGSNTDATQYDLLPSSKVLATSIPSNLNKMKAVGANSFATKKALLIDGGQVTSTSVLKGASGWYAAVNCSISDGNDWFIGGSSSVSSKGTISIVNSGLSAASVDLVVYSSKAPTTISKTVPPNSGIYILMDSLAPGEDAIAVNVITRSGRISAFYLDNRKRGLRAIGADYVSSAPQPSKTVIIPNIPTTKSKDGQLLRVLVPGNVDANIKATIFSGDGSFAPSDIDGANILKSSTKDIKFNPIVADSSYSLRLDSDVPILASVLTSTNGDLIWSTTAPPMIDTNIQLGGLTPLIRFYGSAIDVNLSWTDVSGKRAEKHLVGNDTISFRPKIALLRAQFKANNSAIYGGLLLNSGSGYAVIPITPGSNLESAALPRSDARAINRG
jgi:Family of unknown function (DUF5719)